MKVFRSSCMAVRFSRAFCVTTSRHSSNFSKINVEDEAMKVDLPKNDSSHLDSDRNLSSVDSNNSDAVQYPLRDFVLFYRPNQQLINLNTESTENQMSLFLTKRQELVDVRFSEKFKQTIKAIQEAEENFIRSPNETELSFQSIDKQLWRESGVQLKQLPAIYLKLAKIRLTGLVVITSIAGYAVAPGTFDLVTLLLVSLGTGLTSSSANAFNQFLEVPFDSQMQRTKQRPLVKRQISALHAVSFAVVVGFSGAAVLGFGVNPLVAGLGVINLLLYTSVYTPMKRLSIANTWVGSIVGAIPPLMGWAAATGSLDPGAWVLAAILYAWQFPHFCALSWNLRPDYSRAGYRMMSVVDPDLCRRTSLRYSVGLIGLCTLVPYFGVTTWTFAVDSLPLNAYLAYLAYRFYRDGDSSSSRKLFRFSLVHIPALIILMIISKKQYGNQTTEMKLPLSA